MHDVVLPEIEAVIKGFDAAKQSINSVKDKNAQVKNKIEQMERDLIAWNAANKLLTPVRRDILFDMNDESRNNKRNTVSFAPNEVGLTWPNQN